MAQEIAGQFSDARPAVLNGDRPVFQTTKDATLIVNGTGYEVVAAGQTDQILGATGAVGDYLASILIIPATDAPEAVSIKDGNGSAITIFVGGTSMSTHSFPVPLGIKCVNATTPGWKVTTGANVSVLATGSFT